MCGTVYCLLLYLNMKIQFHASYNHTGPVISGKEINIEQTTTPHEIAMHRLLDLLEIKYKTDFIPKGSRSNSNVDLSLPKFNMAFEIKGSNNGRSNQQGQKLRKAFQPHGIVFNRISNLKVEQGYAFSAMWQDIQQQSFSNNNPAGFDAEYERLETKIYELGGMRELSKLSSQYCREELANTPA